MNKLIFALFILFASLPLPTYAATLYLAPQVRTVTVGQTFEVSLKIDTQKQAVNAAEAYLVYSRDTLELVSASQGNVFFMATPASATQVTDQIYFGGGLPTPGYTGVKGDLGKLVFRVKAAGTASVSIISGHVLLNDGNGTEALSAIYDVDLTIISPQRVFRGKMIVWDEFDKVIVLV